MDNNSTLGAEERVAMDDVVSNKVSTSLRGERFSGPKGMREKIGT